MTEKEGHMLEVACEIGGIENPGSDAITLTHAQLAEFARRIEFAVTNRFIENLMP